MDRALLLPLLVRERWLSTLGAVLVLGCSSASGSDPDFDDSSRPDAAVADTRTTADGETAAPKSDVSVVDTGEPTRESGVAETATGGETSVDAGKPPAPPTTWTEHWFEHEQRLDLVAYDDHVAIYFDKDVDRKATDWLLPFMSKLWQYTKKTYGDFGPDRLFSIHHQTRYSGGHPSTYFDASHDHRNVSDCGPGPWPDTAVDLPSHEVAHIVEGASRGVHGSPAFGVWKDSKWAEFYQYDVYVALGMDADGKRIFDKFTAQSDDFPRAGTRWFRDWFYPLWRDHGHGAVMARYFELLAKHFPKNGGDYARDLNWGEYIHFTSGAAGKSLQSLATAAFGWPSEWETQFNQAKKSFPGVTYTP